MCNGSDVMENLCRTERVCVYNTAVVTSQWSQLYSVTAGGSNFNDGGEEIKGQVYQLE